MPRILFVVPGLLAGLLIPAIGHAPKPLPSGDVGMISDDFARSVVTIHVGGRLFYALFVVAAYKAYGKTAARVAMGVMVLFGAAAPSLFPLIHDLVDFRNDVVIPSQLFFAPAAFVCYLWMRHHYGPERTMAEYRATSGAAVPAPAPAQPAPEPQPESEPQPASV